MLLAYTNYLDWILFRRR